MKAEAAILHEIVRFIRNSCAALCVLALVPAMLCAQQSAPGSSSRGTAFDPLRVPRLPSAIQPLQQAPPHWSSIPADQLIARKTPPAGPRIASGAPRIDLSGQPAAPQPALRVPLALGPAASWEGIRQTNVVPPDPEMAVGPEDVILVVNSSVGRYSRAGQQTNLLTLAQWFTSHLNTICPSGLTTCALYDPSITYDQLHGRFLLLAVSLDFGTGRSYFLFAVSNGATYAGGWKTWVLDATLNGSTPTSYTADFPRLGFDNVAVYLTANMFGAGIFRYAKVRILKKSEIYDPATTVLTWADIWDLRNEDGSVCNTLQAPHLRGRAEVRSPGILINASDKKDADHLTLWRIQNPTSATPTAVRTTLRGIWPYDIPKFAPQLNSAATLDPGDTRILKAILRNGVLYTARNTSYADEPTTVTYDRIDVSSNKVTLQARLVNGYFFFPAFDLPASLGPGNVLPNKLIVGTTTNASGALTHPGISDLKAGEAHYDVSPRWGDFYDGAVDPVHGGLWVYGQYARPLVGTIGEWGTWVGYYPWSSAPQFNDVPPTSPYYNYINVLRLWGLTGGCNVDPPLYCPTGTVTRGQISVFLIRAMFGEQFTYSSTPYFNDVPAGHMFFPYIQKMSELGLTAGCSTNPPLFCPDTPITRLQMAIFVVRGKLMSLHGNAFPHPTTAYFTDVPSTHPNFAFVQKLRELGIVTAGCTATEFCPTEPLKREEIAMYMTRAFLN